MPVHYFNADISFTLKDKRNCGRFIQQLFSDYGKQLEELNVIFCSDEFLLSLNQSSMQHDYYTDIITFDLSVNKQLVIGELYISIERVRDNAIAVKQAFVKELHRVIFHGCLHLCGLKDKKKKDIEIMRYAEDLYLDRYFN